MIESGTMLKSRYRIEERIGSGGMAEVYKAMDTSLNRYVAIKVLRSEYSSDATFVKKFKGEAQSAAGLSHPNIVSVYDFGEENGTQFIVMELVEGITLKNYIEMKGKLDIKEALNISVQIAMGLSAAHDKRIIHRDIKPQNIIMSRDGKVKVTDFGIAKMADSTTVTTTAAGTVQYISPEQARGGYSDEKSDIYSLGITMYEMVTGDVPFQGETNVAVALLHIQSEMVPPREIEPSIPVSFEKIILKCTQKKPDYRYASARDLIADLRKVLSHPDGEYVTLPKKIVPTGGTVIMNENEVESVKAGIDRGEKEELSAVVPAADDTAEQAKKARKKRTEPVKDDYDMDEDDDSSSLAKLLMVFGIIGFLVLIGIIIFLLVNASGFLRGTTGIGTAQSASESITDTASASEETESIDYSSMVEIPELTNMTYDEAKSLLNGMGIGIYQEYGYSDDYEEGKIYEQSPVAGEMVQLHSQVKVYVAEARSTFLLPDVSGSTYQEATEELKGRGLEVKLDYEKSDELEVDDVIRTEPASGSQVQEGDTITLYVCDGAETEKVMVPDVRGYSLSEAQDKLEEAGLIFDGSSEDYSSYYDEGEVISQSIDPYNEVGKNSRVSLVISKGRENATYVTYTEVPDPFPNADYSSGAEPEGQIVIQITQDGETEDYINGYYTERTRPYTLEVRSKSNSEATLTMYVDGEKLASWEITDWDDYY